MRILVISPFFYPHIGGSQRYMEELYASLLSRCPDMKVDVLTYNTDRSPAKELYKGMTIYRVGCFKLLPGQFAVPNPIQLTAMLLRFSKHAYTIVHANTRFFESSWWAWAYARLIGAKSILTDHVAGIPRHPNRTIRSIAAFLDATITAWSVRRYDAVTATNTKTLTYLKQKLHRKDAVLSYGGIDTAFYSPGVKKLYTIPGLKHITGHRNLVITFAGRLIPTKNPELFLRTVVAMYPSLPPNTHIVIAGSGPLYSSLEQQIHAHHADGYIHLTGPLNQKNMRTLLRSTDIFVHPSDHAEGFPNAVLEAGASGCFVIATDNAGTSEIIRHMKSGFLIPMNKPDSLRSALRWTVNNPEKRRQMSRRCREFITDTYSWKHIYRHMYYILKSSFVTSRINSPAHSIG